MERIFRAIKNSEVVEDCYRLIIPIPVEEVTAAAIAWRQNCRVWVALYSPEYDCDFSPLELGFYVKLDEGFFAPVLFSLETPCPCSEKKWIVEFVRKTIKSSFFFTLNSIDKKIEVSPKNPSDFTPDIYSWWWEGEENG